MSILIAFLVFGFLVLTHELGHFLLAKKAGIGVIEFSIGMGPRIVSKQIGETKYSLKWIPFGGSCMMIGEDSESDEPNAFHKKSVWARISVVAAGPLFNFLFAFLLALVVIAIAGSNPAKIYHVQKGYGAEQADLQEGDVITAINGKGISLGRDIDLYFLNHPMDGKNIAVTYERGGKEYTVSLDPHYTAYRMGISYFATKDRPAFSEVTENSPAAQAGIEVGDVVLRINGTAVATGEELGSYLAEHPIDGSPLELELERNGKPFDVTLTPEKQEGAALGFRASDYREKTDVLGVLKGGVQEVRYWVSFCFTSLKMLVTGQAGIKDMSGPVGIVSLIDTTVEQSRSDGALYVLLNVLNLAILLSANLGVFNLLPIPALDGGRLVFLIIEALRGKPVSPDKEGMVHTVGFALLMLLMVVVLYNDIARIFG
ncbi:RIP metalloprotease RseP [Hominifimenecus sp. rT4P-3]|uniref:RIP metalloprotease RseP n=1 Tax=Hominifimenecus sp. rT4P-3 TaxID=3242979 RepID=UPI003DA4FE16